MMGRKRLLFSVLFLILAVNTFALASAADVAYIVTTLDEIKPEFLSVLGELHFSYDIVLYNEVGTYNFSTARLLLLNNEYFPNWAQIPVNDFPAVVANGRNMDEWGWAKKVTSSSQDTPIRIFINTTHEVGLNFNSTIRAHTQVGPDIYYLDKKDVFSGVEIVASNVFDHADAVVAVARAGTVLTKTGYPDTHINADTCFFGITESAYWTNNTRRLFKSCVDFVSVDCFDDSYCPDVPSGEPYCLGNTAVQNVMDFYCQAPGTSASQCVDDLIPTPLEDCGSDHCDSWGGDYCGLDGNVYMSRTCYDAGCAGAGECFETPSLEEMLVEDCDDVYESCSAGSCTDLEVVCDNDLDCGVDGWLDDMTCQSDDVYDDYVSYTCVNAGTPGSYCTDSTELLLKEDCSGYCAGGSCVECTQDSQCPDDVTLDDYCSVSGDVFYDVMSFSCEDYECVSDTTSELSEVCAVDEVCSDGACEEITCSSHSDCGVNGFEGLTYCDASFGNAYENFVSYVCHNPGTAESYCSDYSLPILVEYCDFACVSGGCVECFNDLGCGEDGYIGDPYCSLGGDAVQLYEEFTCSSPSTPESACSSEVTEVVTEYCDDLCIAGECVDVTCDDDSDCDDADSYTLDTCHNPGEESSYCDYTPITCNFDSDCDDLSIWTEDECHNPGEVTSYCDNTPIECFVDLDCNDLDDLTIDECNNPGSTSSYCSNDPFVCVDDSDCDDSDSGTIDDCHNPGTLSSYCTNEPVECFNDADCDDLDLYTEDDCVNPGLVTSYCENTPIECFVDLDCSDSDSGTLDECHNPGLTSSYCTNDPFECSSDSDCDDLSIWTEDECHNPGTLSSYCENTPIECFVDLDCSDSDSGTLDECHNPGLTSSYCTNDPFECSSDSDCDDLSIWTEDECHNPGTLSSYCENTPIVCFNDADCSDSDSGTLDECHNPGLTSSYCTNDPFECSSDSDCPDGGYVGDAFCDNDDIFWDFEEAMCIDPGLVISECGFDVVPHYIDSCPYACDSGVCVRCDEDSDCDDGYALTDDECHNPDTVLSYCENGFTGDCTPGETQSCGDSNVGECSYGTETCDSGGEWGACVGDVAPVVEICNGLDDDCDDETDEGGVCDPVCINECVDGERTCVDDGYKVCRDYNGDGCTEWSGVANCGFGDSCDAGYCV